VEGILILVGGGSRSGKSTTALRLLKETGPRAGFIATAEVGDDEMRTRIARHRAEREPGIVTWEEPLQVAERIAQEDGRYDAIVVDCLTLWLSNLMLAGHSHIEEDGRRLADVASRARTRIIFVTNEVGCGIVPDDPLTRRFRDEAGRLNQMMAEKATEVHWMIFGIGLRIK
jgi:adenosylcobinamide kinase/adenosylcobinamide-phosphate guanylyltransferase